MKKTENLELNQWESTDRIMMEDFNNDNQIIDAALGPLVAAMPGKGNCQIHILNYVGANHGGSSDPSSLEFPKTPVIMFIFSNDSWFISYPQRGLGMAMDASGTYRNSCNLQGNTITWYAMDNIPSHQMDAGSIGYTAVALIDAST